MKMKIGHSSPLGKKNRTQQTNANANEDRVSFDLGELLN